MNIQQEVIILGVSRYDFADQQTGEVRKGSTVWFYDTAGVKEENKVGLIPSKASLAYEEFENLKGLTFPVKAVANVGIDLSKGKLKVSGFTVK